jgi:ornithine decarboxylase
MARRAARALALGDFVHTDSFLHLKIKGDIIARIFSSLSHRSVRVTAPMKTMKIAVSRELLSTVSTHREKVTLDSTDFTDVAAVVITTLKVAAAFLRC